MRIGEFSRRFSVTAETVRFYINKGLLVPASKNDRYAFSEQDITDMEFLLHLKSMRFSLSEIHRIMSIKRLSNLDSAEELSDYIAILKRHKKELIREKNKLEEVIDDLTYEIQNTTGKHTVMEKRSGGVSLAFLPYLACPHCQSNLDIQNCQITGDQIMQGTLTCSCGFSAPIVNGIILGQSGEISIYDGPDVERNCYRMMSPDLITLMQRDYQWILDKLDRTPTKGKLILEDFVNDYCFCHANFEYMDPDALYIVADKFPEVVAMYKNLIDRLNLPNKVLYIAAGSQLLPLRKGCVDVYIDFASNEYAIFRPGYATDALERYFHDETFVVGSFWHLPSHARTLEELQRQYPENWKHNFDLKYFSSHLKSHWRQVLAFEDLGFVTDAGEGDSFSYHQRGEKLGLVSYYAKGYLPAKPEI